jgi:hypothetical protein
MTENSRWFRRLLPRDQFPPGEGHVPGERKLYPTYIRVSKSQKRVTITVTRRSERPLIVRAWGVFQPDKYLPS